MVFFQRWLALDIHFCTLLQQKCAKINLHWDCCNADDFQWYAHFVDGNWLALKPQLYNHALCSNAILQLRQGLPFDTTAFPNMLCTLKKTRSTGGFTCLSQFLIVSNAKNASDKDRLVPYTPAFSNIWSALGWKNKASRYFDLPKFSQFLLNLIAIL